MSTIANRNESYKETKPTTFRRHELILDVMRENPSHNFTAREIAQILFDRGLTISPDRNQTHPRLNELVKMGIITVMGTVFDELTRRNVSSYSIVNIQNDNAKEIFQDEKQ